MARCADKIRGDALRDLLGCIERKWEGSGKSHTSGNDPHLIINNKYMES